MIPISLFKAIELYRH